MPEIGFTDDARIVTRVLDRNPSLRSHAMAQPRAVVESRGMRVQGVRGPAST
jgi:hypothetical protein